MKKGRKRNEKDKRLTSKEGLSVSKGRKNVKKKEMNDLRRGREGKRGKR